MSVKIQTWITLSLIALGIILAILLTSTASGEPESASFALMSGELKLSETSWDIGDVSMADGDHVKEIHLMNGSESPVTVTELSTSCMCTTAQIVHADGSMSRAKGMPGHGESPRMDEIIEPSEEALLEITFDPNAHGPSATGPIQRSVILKTDSDFQPEIKLRFTGNVTK